MTEGNGGHFFVPIASKWLVSWTDDDDDECLIYPISDSNTFGWLVGGQTVIWSHEKILRHGSWLVKEFAL